MNINKLKEVVEQIQFLKHCGASDHMMTKALVEFLYDETNGQLQSYFMMIDDIRKAKAQEERQVLYNGLQDAMHSMSHMSSLIDENKTKDLKGLNKLLFDPTDGNIAFLINIAKAYFPDGTYGHAAQSGVEFFNKFRALLRKHKDQYLTGDSMDWAKRCGHYDYIKLVLEKDPDNETRKE
jgi:hypothetical protein